MLKSTKPNRCKHCKQRMPEDQARHVLHKECIEAWSKAFLAKRDAKAKKEQAARARVEKAMDKIRKEAIQPIRTLVAAAQAAFNAYIRERDADRPCISCDETNPPRTPGGQWDAGHFKSRGAFPELRFDEDNCHKQCKGCNGGSKHPGKARTVAANYEQRLIARIGQERVDRLNGPQELLKLDRDTLRQIKTIYVAKTRQLRKENA